MTHISPVKYFLLLQLLVFNLQAQWNTNFDLINEIVSKSAEDIYMQKGNLPSVAKFDYTSPPDYSVFKNTVIKSLQNSGMTISDNGEEYEGVILNYTLTQVKFNYAEIFKSGLFGSYYIVRNAEIKGSYSIEAGDNKSEVEYFTLSKVDTVDFDSVSGIENTSYPFTQAELPPEPFLSGLWEPAIALGAAVVAVVLFFSVRSK